MYVSEPQPLQVPKPKSEGNMKSYPRKSKQNYAGEKGGEMLTIHGYVYL